MIAIAFVLLTATSVSAQTTDPPKCCVARQFEVNMGETGGALYNHHGTEVPVLIDSDNTLHYDYYNRTLVMEVNTHNPDNTTTYTRIIQDFKTRTQYVYGSGKCTTSRTKRNFREPCIPDHATFLGRTTIGYGVNSIDIVSWQFPEPDTGNDIKLAVTSETCVPVVDAVYGIVNKGCWEVVLHTSEVQKMSEIYPSVVVQLVLTGSPSSYTKGHHCHGNDGFLIYIGVTK